MAFKMKNPSMAKLAKEAGNNRVSPIKRVPTPAEDKALLAKVEKERIATDAGNKELIKKVKGAYTREASREVRDMSRKEARQETRADRKEARAERKEARKRSRKNKGGAFATEGFSKHRGKNIPRALSSKKKKKAYLAAKRYKQFPQYLSKIAEGAERQGGTNEK